MKRICKILVFTLLLFTLYGCSASEKETTGAPVDLAELLIASIDFPEMLLITQERVGRFYPAAVTTNMSHSLIYLSAETIEADEIAIFQASSKEHAATVKAALNAHYLERIALFASYAPHEAERIRQRMVIEQDRWLIIVISDDPQTSERIVNGWFK